ncbi:MAG: hypothetical protein EAZ95_02845 [Bacteroidetes bacterium]|nr:MAG: hypothetical protein EAZ95_02845 [Bacteroidota bacterium]
MNKEQILQLLTDYCRTMLYGGKTLTEVESFLHVLRGYLRHGEFMRILRNLKRLEESLAYESTQTHLDAPQQQQRRVLDLSNLMFFSLFMLILTKIPLKWGIVVGAVGIVVMLFVWVKRFWSNTPSETVFTQSRFLRQTSRLNHNQNIPEPEKVVIDFIEFFEEEARRRQEEIENAQ